MSQYCLYDNSLSLLQISIANLLNNHIKHGLCTEPADIGVANALGCELGIGLVDLLGVAAGCCLGQQLHLTALFHRREPEDGGFDSTTDRQQAMVLEQTGLAITQSAGNVVALALVEDDAIELLVDGDALVKGTAVLRQHFNGLAEGAKRSAIQRVRVGGSGKSGSSISWPPCIVVSAAVRLV